MVSSANASKNCIHNPFCRLASLSMPCVCQPVAWRCQAATGGGAQLARGNWPRKALSPRFGFTTHSYALLFGPIRSLIPSASLIAFIEQKTNENIYIVLYSQPTVTLMLWDAYTNVRFLIISQSPTQTLTSFLCYFSQGASVIEDQHFHSQKDRNKSVQAAQKNRSVLLFRRLEISGQHRIPTIFICSWQPWSY